MAVHPARSGNDYNVGTLAESPSAVVDVAVPTDWTMTEGGALVPATQSASDSAAVTDSGTVATAGVGDADPTQLPVASGQTKSGSSTYGRNLSAGQNYTDPTTGVTVLKLTDANTPESGNDTCYVHIGQTTSVSLPWGDGGVMRTVCVMCRADPGPTTRAYLVDVNTSTLAISNWRDMRTPWAPVSRTDGALIFSSVDPYIVYIANTGEIRKYNTDTAAFITDSDFPKQISDFDRGSVLRKSTDDNVFCVTQYNRLRFAYWIVDVDSVCVIDPAAAAQGSLTPNGVWGFHGGGSDVNGTYMFVSDTDDCDIYEPDPKWYVSHSSAADKYAFGRHAGTGVNHFMDCSTRVITSLGSISNGDQHSFGNWIVNPNPQSVWAGVSTYGTGGNWTKAIGFYKLDSGDVDPRLLCHTDSNGTGFGAQPHAQASPDGQIVVWQSDQDGKSRSDAFLALVPTS
jgi:hypothetical protein